MVNIAPINMVMTSYFDLGMVYEIVLTTIESLMDYELLIDKLFITQSIIDGLMGN